MGSEQAEEFEKRLNKPPATATVEDIRAAPEFDMAHAGDDFLAQMAARGGAGSVTRDGVTNVDVGE